MAGRNNQVLYKLPGRIKEIRKSRCMTQTDLGIAMGSDKSAVSKLENGARLPDLTTLQNVADALDIPISDLFIEEREEFIEEKKEDRTKDPFMKSFMERTKGIPPEKRATFESLIEAALTMTGV